MWSTKEQKATKLQIHAFIFWFVGIFVQANHRLGGRSAILCTHSAWKGLPTCRATIPPIEWHMKMMGRSLS
jgi:hypothetical protein